MSKALLFGGIELGGTKTIVAIGDGDGTVLESVALPTTEPQALMKEISDFFFSRAESHGQISGLGVGAFGPIVINRTACNYGHLLETPKVGWSGFDLSDALAGITAAPTMILTDVGAAGIGEARYGALKNMELGVYLTVGTGIGGAILCNGFPLPALLHPEMGHIALKRYAGDKAPSVCRFHENCAEGLACGPAIMARFGKSLSGFAPDGEEFALVADYLGQVCAALVLTLSPQRIVLGGGVLKADGLIERTRAAMDVHLNGYAAAGGDVTDFICAPALGDRAGIIGALCCARPDDR